MLFREKIRMDRFGTLPRRSGSHSKRKDKIPVLKSLLEREISRTIFNLHKNNNQHHLTKLLKPYHPSPLYFSSWNKTKPTFNQNSDTSSLVTHPPFTAYRRWTAPPATRSNWLIMIFYSLKGRGLLNWLRMCRGKRKGWAWRPWLIGWWRVGC